MRYPEDFRVQLHNNRISTPGIPGVFALPYIGHPELKIWCVASVSGEWERVTVSIRKSGRVMKKSPHQGVLRLVRSYFWEPQEIPCQFFLPDKPDVPDGLIDLWRPINGFKQLPRK